MSLGCYLTGPFGQSQELYEARNEFKRGRGSLAAVQNQLHIDTEQIISLQQQAQLDFVIDPSFDQYYLLQPFVESVERVQVGPQENWFNNNVFYWRPQIIGPLSVKPGFMERFLHFDLLPTNPMVVLPSPYTLFSLSDVTGYCSKEEAITNLSFILKAEAEYLAGKGVQRIQYDEPVIAVKNTLGSLQEEDLCLLELS